ncbi:DNA repair protein RecO [Vagococcus intermedius]|uniref:DNA repair protein RecO n=1 Tax=Vagococcus intermedius TaxID=2991418 RepID=A0AAF0CVW9_9ENTE|nr:DNA repair protein RecO [Vagococcus intermedius]WEG73944.1 DNA repair protein RecO [Vagococcus intermedius]WEG76024.1 DNA repair protein RecO [Vagococcus intermedius]
MGLRTETKGLVLYTRNHREKDKLVKLFTEKYGKLMFFVRNGNRRNNSLSAAILPFTEANYLAEIKVEGLSFLNDAKDITSHTAIQQDIFISAYGTYILNLVDAAIEDQVYDPALFGFTRQALDYLNEGIDPEIITNIFEIQLLNRFGLEFNWTSCAICGETHGKFDFSSLYSGILCEKHFERDHRRQHADARAIHFIRLFSSISLDQIQSINLKQETKNNIRKTIDELYEEFTGLNLKSKKFIDEMKSWETLIKPLEPRQGTREDEMPDS